MPVLRPHPDAEVVQSLADRGFGRTVLHLNQLTQVYLQKQGGPAPEPAYWLLKPGSGGFPRTGFYLDEQDRRQTDFTEVSPGRAAVSYSTAVRTFVHELNHVMVKRLTGKLSPGGPGTQIHSIGVRTNAETAWLEGFAESFEVMFVDDPDTDPATAAWRQDPTAWAAVRQQLDRYRSLLGAPLSPATITRLQFRSWYPVAEDQVRPAHAPKRRAVSSLFYRWATDEGLRNTYRDERFYTQFGVSPADVTPLENLYLKLFHVLAIAKPKTAAGVVLAYQQQFSDEAALVDAVVRDVLLGQPLPRSPEIWLANPDFRVGTMVYDQFRQLSHIHTFDLNGASLVDLLGVPGVDRTLAEAILKGAPYASLDALEQVDGITPALRERFRAMSSRAEGMAHGDASPLLLSFGSWLLFILGLGGVLGGALYHRMVRETGWVRAILNGMGAALLCLVPGWFPGAWAQALPPVLPLLLFGLPAALWAWWHGRNRRRGLRKLLGWTAAALPAFSLLVLRF